MKGNCASGHQSTRLIGFPTGAGSFKKSNLSYVRMSGESNLKGVSGFGRSKAGSKPHMR